MLCLISYKRNDILYTNIINFVGLKMNINLKNLLTSLIELERPEEIKKYCLPIWNQPFFFKIDKSKAITISYSPTDKGARVNYQSIYEKYKQDHNSLSTQDIFNLLYNFKKENYWRRNFDKIFSALGINESEISHIDMSPFPYEKDEYRRFFQSSKLDNNYEQTLKVVDILMTQLNYILIDGKDNFDIINKYFLNNFAFVCESEIQVNKSRKTRIIKYKHKSSNVTLIYVGTFLYGATCPSNDCINQIIDFIKYK